MSHDPFFKQDLALALARALVGERLVPREIPAKSAQVSLQRGSDHGESSPFIDPSELGGKLLKELDRLGYTVIRQS